MTLSLSFERDDPFDFDTETLICQVAEAVLEAEGCPYACALEVLLTDNDSIREINLAERGLDQPTDVLSFPAVDFTKPSDFDCLEEDPLLFDPDSGELLLGDVVISLDKLLSQAEEYGHSPRREMAFLVVHSLFHLLGYDHMTEEDRLVMEAKQEAVLQGLGIIRE